VRVGVHGDRDARMAQPLGHDLRVNSSRKREGGMRVAEVVEPNAQVPCALRQPRKRVREPFGIQWRAVLTAEDEPLVRVRRAGIMCVRLPHVRSRSSPRGSCPTRKTPWTISREATRAADWCFPCAGSSESPHLLI